MGRPRRLLFRAPAGLLLLFAVAASGAPAPPFALEGLPPGNDSCAGAETLPGQGPFPLLSAITADITTATTTGDPPPLCQSNVSRSVWYSFTPLTSADYRISSCADEGTASTVDDSVLGVYSSGAGCGGSFVPVACDDDNCVSEPFQAVTEAHLDARVQYFFVIWKFDTPAPTAGNTAVQLLISSLALFADGFEGGDTSHWAPTCLISGSACTSSAQCCSGLCNIGFCA